MLEGLAGLGSVAAAQWLLKESTVSVWLVAALMVGGGVVLADAMIPVAARVFPAERCEALGNLVGGALAIVGTVYAIVVGFVVVVVWQSVSDAETTVARESNAIAGLERMSRGYAVPVRRQVQEAARTYLRLVIDEEWDAMAERRSSARADAALVELWNVYTDLAPADRTTPLYAESLSRLNEISDNRRLRLQATGNRIPPLMWLLVYLGAVVTMVLAYAFGVQHGWYTRMVIWILSGMLAFAVFLVAALDAPFDDRMSVEPAAFVFVQDNMAELER